MTVFDTLTPRAGLPPNADLKTIRKDLADNHVAVPASQKNKEAALASIVDDARDHGMKLSIVVLQGNKGAESDMRDLATAVGKTEHGTVAVFSDDMVGSYSDTIPRARLEWAEDPAKNQKLGHSDKAATILVDRLESPQQISPTVVTGAGLVVILLVIGVLYAVKARRVRTPATAPREAGAPVS